MVDKGGKEAFAASANQPTFYQNRTFIAVKLDFAETPSSQVWQVCTMAIRFANRRKFLPNSVFVKGAFRRN